MQLRKSLIWLLLLLIAAPCFAANPIQCAVGTWASAGTTSTASFVSLPSATHQVVVIVRAWGPTSFPSAVTDNQSNTYARINYAIGSNSQGETEIWWDSSVGTPSGTFTVTATWGAAVASRVEICEASGLALDKSGSYSNIGQTSFTVSGSATNAGSNDFVIASTQLGYQGSPDPALSSPPSMAFTELTGTCLTQGFGIAFVDGDCGYKSESSAVTSSASWTASGIVTGGSGTDIAAAIATFTQSAASTPSILLSNGHPVLSNGKPMVSN